MAAILILLFYIDYTKITQVDCSNSSSSEDTNNFHETANLSVVLEHNISASTSNVINSDFIYSSLFPFKKFSLPIPNTEISSSFLRETLTRNYDIITNDIPSYVSKSTNFLSGVTDVSSFNNLYSSITNNLFQKSSSLLTNSFHLSDSTINLSDEMLEENSLSTFITTNISSDFSINETNSSLNILSSQNISTNLLNKLETSTSDTEKVNSVISSVPLYNTVVRLDDVKETVFKKNRTLLINTHRILHLNDIKPTASSSWPKSSETDISETKLLSSKDLTLEQKNKSMVFTFSETMKYNITEVDPIINIRISVNLGIEVVPSFTSQNAVSTISSKQSENAGSTITGNCNDVSCLSPQNLQQNKNPVISNPIERKKPIEYKIESTQSSFEKQTSSRCSCLSRSDPPKSDSVSAQGEICNCSIQTHNSVSSNTSNCTCLIETKNILTFDTNLSNCSCINTGPELKVMNIPLNFACKPNKDNDVQFPSSLMCIIKYDEELLQPSSPFECECNIHIINKNRPNAIQCICNDALLKKLEEPLSDCDCNLSKALRSANCPCNQSTIIDLTYNTALNSTNHYVIDETKELKSVSNLVKKDSSRCHCEEIELLNGQMFLRYNCTCNDDDFYTAQTTITTSTTTITTTTSSTTSSITNSTKLTVTTTTAISNSVIVTNLPTGCKCEELKLLDGKIIILFNCSCPLKPVVNPNKCNCDDVYSAIHCECPTSTASYSLEPTPRNHPSNSCKRIDLMNGQLMIWINCSQQYYPFTTSTTTEPTTITSTIPSPSKTTISQDFTRCKCQDIFFHDSLWIMFNCTCYKNNDVIVPVPEKVESQCRCKRDSLTAQCSCQNANSEQVFVEERFQAAPVCSCMFTSDSMNSKNNCSCISTQKVPRSLASPHFGCVCRNSSENTIKDNLKYSVKDVSLTSPLLLCECNRNDISSTTPLPSASSTTTETTTSYLKTDFSTEGMKSSLSVLHSNTVSQSIESTGSPITSQFEPTSSNITETMKSTPPMEPNLETKTASTTDYSLLNENKKYWIRTVIQMVNVSKTFNQSLLEQQLEKVYVEAFKKFYQKSSKITVKVLNISELENDKNVEIIYSVEDDGNKVLAKTAVDAMELVSYQEMAIYLQCIIIIRAEEYLPILKEPFSAGLSTGEIVIIALCIPLCLILLFICIFYRYKSLRKKNKKTLNQQQVFEEVSTVVSSSQIKNESSPPRPVTISSLTQFPDPPVLINENESSSSSLYSRPHKRKNNDHTKPKSRRKKAPIYTHETEQEIHVETNSSDSQRSIKGLIPHITPSKLKHHQQKQLLPLDIYQTDENASFLPNLKGAFDNVPLNPIPRPQYKPIPAIRLPPMKSSELSSSKENQEGLHISPFDENMNAEKDLSPYDTSKVTNANKGIPWLKKADYHPPAVVITPSAQHKIMPSNWDEIDEIFKMQAEVPCPAEHFIREIRAELTNFKDSLGNI